MKKEYSSKASRLIFSQNPPNKRYIGILMPCVYGKLKNCCSATFKIFFWKPSTSSQFLQVIVTYGCLKAGYISMSSTGIQNANLHQQQIPEMNDWFWKNRIQSPKVNLVAGLKPLKHINYSSRIGSFSQGSGWKSKIFELPPPSLFPWPNPMDRSWWVFLIGWSSWPPQLRWFQKAGFFKSNRPRKDKVESPYYLQKSG